MSVQATPSGVLIRARALTGFAPLLQELGGDADALFRRAGVPPGALDTPDAPVSVPALVALFNQSAHALDVPDLGLRLAQRQDITVLGAVAMVALHSSTVGEGCRAIARYMSYHSPAVQLHVEEDRSRPGYTQFRLELKPGAELDQRQAKQQMLGVAQRFLEMVTGEPGDDWTISFRQHHGLSASQYAGYFNGTVLQEQAEDKLSMPSRLLQVPLAPDRQALRMAAERQVGSLLHRFPLDIAQQVQALVDRHLAAGGSSLVKIAHELGLHERTLQRRLKEHAVYFEDIVDGLRRRRAEEYLSYPSLPLAEVAAMLGYTEQSSFVRVCKRWFGTTPQRYRMRCLRGGLG